MACTKRLTRSERATARAAFRETFGVDLFEEPALGTVKDRLEVIAYRHGSRPIRLTKAERAELEACRIS